MKYPFIKPEFYFSLSLDLFHFMVKPYSEPPNSKSTKEKTHETIGLFFIKIFFSLTIASLLQFIYEPENLASVSMSERFGPLMLLLVGGVILPLFEEITFRLSLTFKPIYLALSSGTFMYYIFTKAVFKSSLSLVDDTFIYRVTIALTSMLLIYTFVRREKVKIVLDRFWKNNFRYIYYGSCVSFAWLHIFNFELNITNLLLLPILTLPQLFSASIAGYTRIAFGFKYPLAIHMATNLLFTLLAFIPLD